MKNKAHVWICGLLSATMAFTSCTNFLEEDSKAFLNPSEYYTTENQTKAAVDGTYDGFDDLLSSDLKTATVHLFNLEYLVGTNYRPRAVGNEQNQFLLPSDLEESNGIIRNFWKATFFPLENCNSVIQNVSATDIISESQKAKYLGEVYFLRAYYYFQGAQLFGDIPLKTKPTVDLNTVKIPRFPKEDIYNQIVGDLKKAEQSGLDWSDKTGHVSMGAIKTLLAKVYLTMADYLLQKGNEYYQLAYERAKEVIGSGAFSLLADYKDLRVLENENSGEHTFMIQHEAQDVEAPFHFGFLLYPGQSISITPAYGGGLAPHKKFYESYNDQDIRKRNEEFFYTSKPKHGDPETMVTLDVPYLCKCWDENAESTGKSRANIPVCRYADALLMCAEAKATSDGESTSNATTMDAYFQARHRALPDEARPTSVTVDQVLRERAWELCYEFTGWYDTLRTHRAFDPVSEQMVDLLDYQVVNHTYSFKESGLVFPVPLCEKELNPLLGEDAVR